MIKTIKFGTPLVFNPGGNPVGWYSNSFNGTFSHNKKPISIMVNKGKSIRGNSCHHIWDKPETVIWIKKDGSYGSNRVVTWTQIPGYNDIIVAIGGMGISDYEPVEEGFCKFEAVNRYTGRKETKDFSDVRRKAYHSVFGFYKDKFFGAIMYGTDEEIKAECDSKGFTHVILCDGGSWAACNTEEYDLNLNKDQYSAVQIINLVDVKLPVEQKPQWRYFKYSEFTNTKDGYKNETSYDLIDKLDELRHLVNRPIRVTSGYRTPAFNKLVGGSPNSEHIYGLAADIRFNFKGYSKESIIRICKYLGFKNVGIYWKWGRIGGTIDRLHLGIDDRSNGRVRIMDWSASGRLLATTFI